VFFVIATEAASKNKKITGISKFRLWKAIYKDAHRLSDTLVGI